jgi:TetR/AcrR family fatty acid metabolism transcriptional regulator
LVTIATCSDPVNGPTKRFELPFRDPPEREAMDNIVKKTEERLKEYEKRHQAILTAAMRLFNANGYVATTTASIAREAGVTEKTMYKHFENKEALFSQCIDSITRNLADLWKTAFENHKDDNLAYLTAISRSFADFVINNPDRSKFLVHLYTYRQIPELDEGFRKDVEQRIDTIEKVIRSLQENGSVKTGIHPRVLAGVFVGSYFTTVFLNEFLGPDLLSAETAVDLTKNLLRSE